jgi:hypothetical protein
MNDIAYSLHDEQRVSKMSRGEPMHRNFVSQAVSSFADRFFTATPGEEALTDGRLASTGVNH